MKRQVAVKVLAGAILLGAILNDPQISEWKRVLKELTPYPTDPVPEVSRFNKDGLPASPFRTDNFPLSTEPKHNSPVDGAQPN